MLETFKKQAGIRLVKNLVMVTKGDTSRIDLTPQYAVTGFSKRDEKDYYVVINGRILGQGDTLDGMHISKIMPKTILLEKEGVQFRINYNIQ